MSEAWAVRILLDDANSIGRLWQRPEIEVLAEERSVWLRGHALDETLDKALRSLPGARRFGVLPDRQLVPSGKTVPKGHLPEGAWVGLKAWMAVELPSAGFGGVAAGEVALKLVRCHTPSEPNVLLATFAAWSDYAIKAPRVRLARLAFAAAEAKVVVRGVPVPPIQGMRFMERRGVASPVGWTWTPPVDADVVREHLRLGANDLALLHPDGSWDHILADDFVEASRSAVRRTAGGRPDA